MSGILVIGFGTSGEWAARLALTRGLSVHVYDDRDIGEIAWNDLKDRVTIISPGAVNIPDEIGRVVLSPGGTAGTSHGTGC